MLFRTPKAFVLPSQHDSISRRREDFGELIRMTRTNMIQVLSEMILLGNSLLLSSDFHIMPRAEKEQQGAERANRLAIILRPNLRLSKMQ